MKHLDREPTRSILLRNLPRVAGYQVPQLKAEICDALTEATSGKVTNIRYNRPKASAVITFSKRMSVVKALQRGKQGKIFVRGTRVKLFRTPDPVLIQTKDKRQHYTNSEQYNTWQERTELSVCHADISEINSYMYLPFHKHPYRPQHISEHICSRMAVPKSQRSNRKRKKFVLLSKAISKSYSSKKAELYKKRGKQNKKRPKKKATTVAAPRRYTVYVQGLSTLIPVEVRSNNTIAVLKAAIKQKEGIKIPAKATLWCKGYKLVDLLTLDDQLVGPESNVTLHIGLQGGSDKDQVTEKELQKLAKNLGGEWERLAIYLDMKKADVDKFKADNPYKTEQQIFAMLVRWKETQGSKATRDLLRKKLREAEVDEEKLSLAVDEIGAAAKFPDTCADADQFASQQTTSRAIPPEKGREEWLVDTLHKLLTEEGKALSVNELANQFYKRTSLYGKKFKDYGFGPLKAFIEAHQKQFKIGKEKQGTQLVVTPIQQKKKKQKKGSQNQQPLHANEKPEETQAELAVAGLHVGALQQKVGHDKKEGNNPSINDFQNADPKTTLTVSTLTSSSVDTGERLDQEAENSILTSNQEIKVQTIPLEAEQVPCTSPSKVDVIPESQLHNLSLPEKLFDWTTDHVCHWLQGLQLNRDKLPGYIEAFKKEDICGKVLPTLADAGEGGRTAFGVSFGDWAKIVPNIRKLQQPAKVEAKVENVSAFAVSCDTHDLESSHDAASLTHPVSSATSADEIWESVLESVDYFKTSARAYCLVIYNDQQDTSANIEALADVAWTKVFDFDPNSRESGTFSRCEVPLRDRRSLYITTCRDNAKNLHDKATEWFFPLDDLTVGERDWMKSVSEIINAHTERLADFCCDRKPLTVVIMWYGSYRCLPHLRRLLEKIDEKIRDEVKFVFCVKEMPKIGDSLQKFNEMCSYLEITDTNIHTIPLSALCQKLQHQHQGNNKIVADYMLPALKEGILTEVKVEQKDVAWLAEELDILYLQQDHSTTFPDENALGHDFYHGGTISWYELKLGTYDVERDIQVDLQRSIRLIINRHRAAIKTLYHAPGAGGTTLARRILWNLHLERICPCAFVTSLAHDNDAIYKRIKWLHNKTNLPIFVVEDSRISKTESRLIRETFEMCRRSTPLVILDVQRFSSKIEKVQKGDKFWLKGEVSKDEATRLAEVFSRNCPEKRRAFMAIVEEVKARKHHYVFEFGLTAFEYDFRGVQSYVSGYLKYSNETNDFNLMPWQWVVGYLSLTYYYGQARIPAHFFANILHVSKKDVVDFDNLPFEAKKFVCKEDDNYWRISLHVLAKEILEQILCPQPHGRESNVRLSSAATKNLESFTTMFINEAGSRKARLCPDILNAIRVTFFSRDNKEILMEGRTKRNLSPVLLDIPSQPPLFTERFKIFQLLAEIFPRDPHCLAHLARFCALEREEYEVAKKHIEKAVQIREFERHQYHRHYATGSFDGGIETENQYADRPLSRIYNMKGCIYHAEMSSIIGRLGKIATCKENADVNEVITEAVALAKTASAAFAKCRSYYKKGNEEAIGYVPDINLRLNLLEFIQRNFEDYESYVGSETADDYIKALFGEIDSLIRECYDKIFILPIEFHTCVDWYYLLFHDAAKSVHSWTDVSSIRGRKGKLAAYRMLNHKSKKTAAKNIWYWDSITEKSDIEDIITLYERNFQEVIEKGLDYNIDNDMKDWLLSIRHKLVEPYTIEEVLVRVRQWYEIGKSPYSTYYLYVLTAVLAIGVKNQTGSRKSFAELKRIRPQLQRASQSIGRPKICREFVSSSICGIKRLLHNHELKSWDLDSRTWKFKGDLEWFTGTIRICHSEVKGIIEMDMGRATEFDGIEVYFVPAPSGFSSRRFVNTRVQFLLGFSFEHGPEAFNVTELKHFLCKRCKKNVEMPTADRVRVFHCKCGFPITVHKQGDDTS